MPRSLKWGVLGVCTIIISKYILASSITHFKCLGMTNLLNEIIICQKIHTKVTMTISSYFDFSPFCPFPENPWKAIFHHFLWVSLDRIIVPAPSISHFKVLGMKNLQYEMRICQKVHSSHNNNLKLRWNLLHQTLLECTGFGKNFLHLRWKFSSITRQFSCFYPFSEKPEISQTNLGTFQRPWV